MVTTVAPTMPVLADDDHRQAESAAQAVHQLDQGAQQLVGQPRALQHDAHEDEHRHRDQRLVGHDAVNAVRKSLEENRVEGAREHTDAGENQGHAGQGEGHREAGHQRGADADEQGQRHPAGQLGLAPAKTGNEAAGKAVAVLVLRRPHDAAMVTSTRIFMHSERGAPRIINLLDLSCISSQNLPLSF
jgi:hypothetical protein